MGSHHCYASNFFKSVGHKGGPEPHEAFSLQPAGMKKSDLRGLLHEGLTPGIQGSFTFQSPHTSLYKAFSPWHVLESLRDFLYGYYSWWLPRTNVYLESFHLSKRQWQWISILLEDSSFYLISCPSLRTGPLEVTRRQLIHKVKSNSSVEYRVEKPVPSHTKFSIMVASTSSRLSSITSCRYMLRGKNKWSVVEPCISFQAKLSKFMKHASQVYRWNLTKICSSHIFLKGQNMLCACEGRRHTQCNKRRMSLTQIMHFLQQVPSSTVVNEQKGNSWERKKHSGKAVEAISNPESGYQRCVWQAYG